MPVPYTCLRRILPSLPHVLTSLDVRYHPLPDNQMGRCAQGKGRRIVCVPPFIVSLPNFSTRHVLLRNPQRPVKKSDVEDLLSVYAKIHSAIVDALTNAEGVIGVLEKLRDGKPITFITDPSERLPNELLSRIFEFAAPTTSKNAFAISQVNRHWRAVSLATPPMWATFKAYSMSDLRLLQIFMERSGACPVTIKTPDLHVWRNRLANPDIGPVATAINVIVPYASKWQHVVIKGANIKDLRAGMTPYLNISTPILEEIRFSSTHDDDPSPLPMSWLFQHAPRLHTLDTGLFDFDLRGIGAQLEDLKATVRNNYVRMMEQCPNLERLCLAFVQQPMDAPSQPIRLGQLTCLTLKYGVALDWEHIVHFLTYIDLPSLDNLYLELFFANFAEPPAIGQMTPSSLFPKLDTLFIHIDGERQDKGEHYHQLINLLVKFTSVTTFTIQGADYVTGIIHEIAVGTLFPHLMTLEFSCCNGVDDSNLYQMLRNRGTRAKQPTGSVIKRLAIHRCQSASSCIATNLNRDVQSLSWLPY